MELLQRANLKAVMFVFAGMSDMESILLTLRLIYLLTKARSAEGMLTAFVALDRRATLLMAQQTCKTEPEQYLAASWPKASARLEICYPS